MEEVMEQLRISQDTVFPHIRVTATGPADMVTAGKYWQWSIPTLFFFGKCYLVEPPPNNDPFTGSVVAEYFSQLSVQEVVQLYELYRVDFSMFGYSPMEYLQYCKH